MSIQESAPSLSSDNSSQKTLVIAARNLPTYYGGLSQYQRSLATYLSQDRGVKGLFLGERLLPGEQIQDIHIDNWDFFHFAPNAKWEQKRGWLMRAASRPILHGLLERTVSSFWTSLIEKKLPREVDAIHYIGTGWDLFGFALLRVARQRKVGFTVWPAVHPGDWGDDVIDLRLYKQADRIFAQSDNEKVWLIKKGLPAEKVVRTGLPPMCLDSGDSTDFRSHYGLSARPTVLYIGRKDEGKGYFALLEAWKQVQQRFPQACLITVGPGANQHPTSIRREVDGVLDLGIVSEQEKADALAACNIFCLPSAHESFGIVYLEAWFYAKPVICGAAPACRELVDNQINGLWSDQESRQLATDICTLLSNPDAATQMGEKGKQKQLQQFTWEKVGSIHYDEFFKRL